MKRLMKGARFRIPSADVHDIYYVDRHLDREQLLTLSSSQFISEARNFVFRSFTGSGKRYLACALGKEACKQGIRTRYIRMSDLLMEWEEDREMPHSVPKLLKKYSNYTLLILDEWLIQTPTEPQFHFLFELIERRYDENSIIESCLKSSDSHPAVPPTRGAALRAVSNGVLPVSLCESVVSFE